jgi:hypothetical protein
MELFSPRKLRARKPVITQDDLSGASDTEASDTEAGGPKASSSVDATYTFLDAISPRKLPLKVSTVDSPPSDDRLIETTTLKQLGLAYNVKYNIIICKECETAIPLHGIPDHAYKSAIRKFEWNSQTRTWKRIDGQKHNRPKFKKSPSKNYTAKEIRRWILEELEDTLQRSVSPHQFSGSKSLEDRMDWIKIARPDSDQIGPICGLKVYEHAFKCTTGSCQTADMPYFGLVPDSIRGHAKTHHPEMTASSMQGFTVQTMAQHIGFTFYFEVSSLPTVNPVVPGPRLPPAEVVRQERQRLLGHLTTNRGLDRDLIDEAYADVGMKQFWETLDMDMITPLFALDNHTSRMSSEDRVLQTAIVATFLDISLRAPAANPSLLHLISKGA